MSDSPIWVKSHGASREDLAGLRDGAPIPLPDAYMSMLADSDGGEGHLAVEPGWISLWRAEEVLRLNEGYEVFKNLPGFFGLGSNGAGELLALDARGAPPFPVVMVPFIPLDANDAVRIAGSFDELVEKIGRSGGDAA